MSDASNEVKNTEISPSQKQWQLIEKLLNKSLDEQIKTRRWNWIFRIIFIIILLMSFGLFNNSQQETSVLQSHTAMVAIQGEIGEDQPANADDIIEGLRNAFKNSHTKAVLLRINSPGGSPVQASMVYDEIMRLKKQSHKKVYAAIIDTGASGAYYIAAAADAIYANPSSIVGSIGVVSEGFGFVNALGKIGIERRIWTAGENKVELDPYLPIKPENSARLQTLLDDIHQQFIADVKAGRGARIKSTPEIFSGLFWTGKKAMSLGLIDGLASPDQVARNIIKEPRVVDYTVKPDLLSTLSGKFGVMLGQGLAKSLGLRELGLR